MLNVDLMRVKPLRGPLKRDDAKELQKALKEAGVINPTYWNFNSQFMYFINPKNLIVVDACRYHLDYITFEDLFVENYEDCQFESELMTLLGG
jgi:hypothetical protein